MKNQVSFSTLGNEFMHEMRDRINNSENIVDLENGFSYTVSNFLNEVFKDEDFVIDPEDINLEPAGKEFFRISEDLMKQDVFKEIWESSDLSSVIRKFTDSAYHHYIRLNKHTEKTRMKIRNH